ncbi:NAD-dependent epimerase/dehydratase family protein [Aquirufa ecclesiirivi]|uniref:NAD-dependent epimerase/dehydratase family protein n=1 Tax=Aquirufa ecclesiirivi TaxID=2715124 RepID=UPI00140BD9A0|nr:NAD-dependent epimerase/dehydratase family protein [Aquirufa ecclesiirivi]NHC49138.1 NAD-dependent epimerase/dehydratase family protein [Aquirufa ecclesiirivi]
MEKILLIGGAGFLGLNWIQFLENQLASREVAVTVLSRHHHADLALFPQVKFVQGDYGDLDVLNRLFLEEHFTQVFHFASTIVPATSTQNVSEDLEANLTPTIQLLEVMKQHDCRFLVYFSSGGAVYGHAGFEALNENQACKPISSYGIIKLAVEHYIQLYSNIHQIDYLILRLSNPFGYFHHSDQQGVINIALRKALRGETFTVWGDGSQTKDYIFAEDIAKAIFQLWQSGHKNDTINIGYGSAISLSTILEKIKGLIPSFQVVYKEAKPTDVPHVCLDISKLESLIPFEKTPFDEALERTWKWEEGNL